MLLKFCFLSKKRSESENFAQLLLSDKISAKILLSEKKILKHICLLFSGRAAEEKSQKDQQDINTTQSDTLFTDIHNFVETS